MKVFTRSSLATSGLLLVLVLGQPAPKSFGGKPQPPAPPPVRYAIQFFNSPSGGGYFNDFNNRAQAVGWFVSPTDGQKRAWFYDPAINSDDVIDLNTIVPVADVPNGWIIASAVGLNEKGDLVGYLQQLGDTSNNPVRRGYVLDMSTLPPTLTLIPDGGLGSTYPKDLNNQGLVLGTFARADGSDGKYLYQSSLYGLLPDASVTDLGLVVKNVERTRLSETSPVQFAGNRLDGVAYRYTEGQAALELFPELSGTSPASPSVLNTNAAGGFCGSGIYQPARGKSFRTPIRVLGEDAEFITSLPGKTATALNRRGDLAIGYNSLYWDAHGLFHLNALVDGDAATLGLWTSATNLDISAINDPDPLTGFGEVAGRIFFADGTRAFFYLTPIPAP